MARDDEIGADETAAGRQQPPDERCGDGKRGIGHDVKRLTGEPQVAGIGHHDDDRLALEAFPELEGASFVQLDGDDAGSCSQQRRREGARAGADVEDESSRTDGGVLHEASRPALIESVVPPPVGIPPGHGGP